MRVYLQNAGSMVALCAVAVIPIQLLQLVLIVATVSDPSGVPGSYFTGNSGSGASTGARLLVALLSLVTTALATAACVHAASNAYKGEKVDADESLRRALRRILPILTLSILLAVLLVIAFILLVIPGVYLYVAWSVATPALMLEGLAPGAALRRSRELVKGRWWRVAGVLIVTGILVGVVVLAVTAALLALLGTGSTVTTQAIIQAVAGSVGAIIVLPFSASIATVLYYMLRGERGGIVPVGPESAPDPPADERPTRPRRRSANHPTRPRRSPAGSEVAVAQPALDEPAVCDDACEGVGPRSARRSTT